MCVCVCVCVCINTVKSGYPVKASVHVFVCVMSFMISLCETAQTRVWICVYRSVGIMSSRKKQKNGWRGSNRRQKLVGKKKKGEVEMSTGRLNIFWSGKQRPDMKFVEFILEEMQHLLVEPELK